jgi:hypothetical protein
MKITDVKKISDPARFLLETGLLFKINHEILHPYGLALELEIGERDFTFGIWDYQNDPEGILYSEKLLKEGAIKLKKYEDETGSKRKITRIRILGFEVQPLEKKNKDKIDMGDKIRHD